jgi:hypothetical protein
MKKLLVVLGLAMAAFSFQASAATLSLVSTAHFTTNMAFTNGSTIGSIATTPAGNVSDVWNLFVGAGEIAKITFEPKNLAQFGIKFFNIDNFTVLPNSLMTGLAAGSHFFSVTGISNGLLGGSYQVGASVAQTPIPAAVWLFGSALMGLTGISRRKSANA